MIFAVYLPEFNLKTNNFPEWMILDNFLCGLAINNFLSKPSLFVGGTQFIY